MPPVTTNLVGSNPDEHYREIKMLDDDNRDEKCIGKHDQEKQNMYTRFGPLEIVECGDASCLVLLARSSARLKKYMLSVILHKL